MISKLDNMTIAVLHLYNVDEKLPNGERCFHDKIDKSAAGEWYPNNIMLKT